VAQHVDLFRPYHDQLAQLLQREIDRAVLRQGELHLFTEGGARKVLIRWTGWSWRTFGLREGHTCKVAISTEQPPDVRNGSVVRKIDFGAERGVKRPVPATAGQVLVTVWPVLRLDALQIEVAGLPLHLSTIPEPQANQAEGGMRRFLKKLFG
jgi:hypothetical protein